MLCHLQDPEPHVHYDVICTGCSAASEDIFDGGAYRWWSKYYPEGVCTLAACGAPGEVHQATNLGALNGQTVYKYGSNNNYSLQYFQLVHLHIQLCKLHRNAAQLAA